MAVAIRLMRFGKKGYHTYRIVALDKRKKRDGSYIEKVGVYNPMSEPTTLELNNERLTYWLNNGAQVSEGMRKLLKMAKFGVQEVKKEPKKKAAPKKVSEAEEPAKTTKTTKSAKAKKTEKTA